MAEELELRGLDYDELAQAEPVEPEPARREGPVAPTVEERELDALFGVSEDPQSGDVKISMPGEEPEHGTGDTGSETDEAQGERAAEDH